MKVPTTTEEVKQLARVMSTPVRGPLVTPEVLEQVALRLVAVAEGMRESRSVILGGGIVLEGFKAGGDLGGSRYRLSMDLEYEIFAEKFDTH